MKNLTRKEELLLLSIMNLGKDAYLIAIVDYLSRILGRTVSLTSAHIPLNRLLKGGLIDSRFGEASAVRGGRRKKIYNITKTGFEALEEHKRISDILWKNYSDFSLPVD